MVIFVTGGAGFIGSNFLNMFVPKYPQNNYINIDKLTYASRLLNLQSIESLPNYYFENISITDYSAIDQLFNKYMPDIIIHFAAESHVDRSILGPAEFVETNIVGTFNLLEACRKYWVGKENKLFHHVSTDEVYGSLGEVGLFNEKTAYDPHSPYSASKASSDHLVRAYYHTYGIPIKITNCSNNYGPYQFPEKLIPLMITNALKEKPLPVYGDGSNVRDWIYVEDHNRALWSVIEKGRIGETYNIGANCEKKNIEIVNLICEILAEERGKAPGYYNKLIVFIKDRLGHDYRYAIDSTKIAEETNWAPLETFETGLRKTVRWYLKNKDFVDSINTGDYKSWINANYLNRK
jgi:dTDP-glucose 4,6-dehydratase